MKKRMLLILGCILILCGCSNPDAFDPFSGEGYTQADIGIGNGWNLGNTLDACSYGNKINLGLDTEASWGMPYTTQAMISAIAQKGFKTIRIPVSYHNHITEGTNYTIDSAWMARVKTIVDWSLTAGMKVIINIHHDNLLSAELKTTYGFTVNADSGEQTTSKKYIERIWTQVADCFKSYDDHLIFEVLNEPRNRDASNDGFSGASNLSTLNKIIREYEQVALNAIRASGGKNASRYVMVPPYAANPDMTTGWSLPNESAPKKLIVSVHAYTPYEFCMNTASTKNFTDSYKGSVDWLFTNIKTNFTAKGIFVVIGETSASDKNNLAERKKWFSYYYDKADSANIPVIVWDNMLVYPQGDDAGERHGYFNRDTLSWFFPTLIDEMVK